LRAKEREEFSHAVEKAGMGGPGPEFEDHYAGTCRRRVPKHLAKIPVQGNQRSPLALADFEDPLVRGPSQPLLDCRNDIVAGSADQIAGGATEIFVELELHATFSVGTGITRSRAASAPYAIAANTSS